jgi:hypothetical protein
MFISCSPFEFSLFFETFWTVLRFLAEKFRLSNGNMRGNVDNRDLILRNLAFAFRGDSFPKIQYRWVGRGGGVKIIFRVESHRGEISALYHCLVCSHSPTLFNKSSNSFSLFLSLPSFSTNLYVFYIIWWPFSKEILGTKQDSEEYDGTRSNLILTLQQAGML